MAIALYAIGDLHLAYQSEVRAPMQRRGRIWQNHEAKLKKYCEASIKPEDTLVLVGDHSWGKKLAQCEKDLAFIEALPGRKILTRGNHVMFWDAKKTKRFNDSLHGEFHGIDYHLVSGDYLKWRPKRIL